MKVFKTRTGTLSFAAAALSLLMASPTFAALIYRIDIDTDVSNTSITTETGWTSLDAGGGNGSAVTVGDATFAVSGAAGSRNRSDSNNLTRDFIFKDGADATIGLSVSGLINGIWEAAVYAWDAGYTVGNQLVGITQPGGALETIYTSSFAASATQPFTFQFDSSTLGDGFDIFTRENNDNNNRARFNALELRLISAALSTRLLSPSSVPAPTPLLLVVLGLIGLASRRTLTAAV